MNKETKWDATYYTGTASELKRRQELLEETKVKVHDLLSDIEEKIHNTEYQHILIRNELDTILERLLAKVDDLKETTGYLYEEFTDNCQPIIDRTKPVPIAVRNKSDELLTGAFDENYLEDYEYGDGNKYKRVTLTKYKDKIEDVVSCYHRDRPPLRLDRERDTPEEFSNILTMFPGACENYKVPYEIIKNYSSRIVPFLPAILGIVMKDWNGSEYFDRCGLICHGGGTNIYMERQEPYNHIRKLVETPNTVNDKDHFDDQCTTVLIWLRQNGLFLDTDVTEFNLMNLLLRNLTITGVGTDCGYFARKRFQFLVKRSPNSLTVQDTEGRIPLYNAAAIRCRKHMIDCFIAVFRAGIQHLSNNIGFLLLFQTNNVCRLSPYQYFFLGISKKEEHSQRIEAIETVLNDPTLASQHHRRCSSAYTTIPAFIDAATSAQITLDGLFFIVRREPDILQKLIVRRTQPNTAWRWPNKTKLVALEQELGALQQGLATTRATLLATEYDSPDELHAIEARVAPRRDRDAAIVMACTRLLAEWNGDDDDATSTNTNSAAPTRLPSPQSVAFRALDQLAPIPPGLLRPQQHEFLRRYLAAQIQRHSPAVVQEFETKAVRARCAASLDEDDETDTTTTSITTKGAWLSAQQTTHKFMMHTIERYVPHLLWSDHRPIRATVTFGGKTTLRVAAWNILERKANGIHPVLPLLPFLSGRTKDARRTAVARLADALLHPTAVTAQAAAVVAWTREALTTHDVVCLSEVGDPVVQAFQNSTGDAAAEDEFVIALSQPTEHNSSQPSRSTQTGGACEGRTMVVARNRTGAQVLPDLPVVVGTKVRYFACLRLQLRRDDTKEEEDFMTIVSVHVPRKAGGASRCPRAGGGVPAAHAALHTVSGQVVAVGDWNGNVADIGGIRVGKPTTYADVLQHPDSQGIDGVLTLAFPDDTTTVTVDYY